MKQIRKFAYKFKHILDYSFFSINHINNKCIFIFIVLFIFNCNLNAAATIPGQAWSRDINAGGYLDGAPIGGFGAGTVTWKFNGIFYKDRLNIAGVGSGAGTDTITFTDDATARFFLYQKPTSSGTATMTQLDAATLGSGQATYYSLFPKAWVDYHGSKFTVLSRVTQFSPIIPGDYQRVSYPEGIYYWDLTNPTSQSMDAAIMLTWQNNYSGVSATVVNSGNFTGILLDWTGTGTPTAANQGQFALGSINGSGVTVTAMSAAAVTTIETAFSTNGTLANTGGANTIGAIAFKITLAPGQNVRIPIVLAWDIPLAQPGTGYLWWRQYTKYFGQTGRAAWTIAQDALTNCASYESQIDTWQSGILTNAYYPDWLKTMLFNELYIYFTGGTIWEAGGASGQATTSGESMFSHLESYIYEFYGTSDVRFYGSWALFLNWPDIDKQAVRQFSDSIYTTRTDRPTPLGTCAHDFGNPNDVFEKWNDYTFRDSTTWKDLNSKFVLMVYRDYHLTGDSDTTFLNYCYKSVQTAMNKVHSECGTDGLPQSSGVDQTYDNLGLTGTTAYCGSLFLAACQAAVKIATAEGDTTSAATYQAWYNTAQPNFQSELWTGSYYQIDTGSTAPTRIMSDQLCGQWYSKALGLGGIVTDANAQTAWQTVYNNNFLKYDAGAHDIVNVMTSAGAIDTSTSQSQESWVGTSWGVVAGMLQQGMATQASAIGQSMFNTIWNTSQFWFRTPEAWTTGVANIRAYYYMRGSTVWACKQAYDLLPSTCAGGTCTPLPTDTATLTPTKTLSPTVTPTINPCGTSLIRVDCGSTVAVQDSQGRTWSADQAFTTGGWGYMGGSAETATTHAISNTVDQNLYQTGHWGSALEYRFTVKNGPYKVRLMWAEINYANTGQRVFNVFLEGQQILSNFDIVAVTGGEYIAYEQSYYVNVTTGVIDITTTNITDDPKFSAIEITDMSTVCTVTVTATKTMAASSTITNTQYPTFTMTVTPSYTLTNTPSRTITATTTASPTSTRTSTLTFSQTPTYSSTTNPSFTFTSSPTSTITPSCSYTATTTYTQTSTQTITNTVFLSRTTTFTPSLTTTQTITGTSTPTFTYTLSASSTQTQTRTATLTYTLTGTMTKTATPTETATLTATPTLTVSPTFTYSISSTPTFTKTATPSSTGTMTDTSTATLTFTATNTASFTATLTFTRTVTPTITNSPVVSPTPTYTNIVFTWTITQTFTISPTITMTNTPLPTGSNTGTPTLTETRTFTETNTPTYTSTYTYTVTLTWTNTPVNTATITISITPSLTYTRTFTTTYTVTETLTNTVVNTFTNTPTFTTTRTDTPTNTPTSTHTPTYTITLTYTVVIISATITPTYTITPTITVTDTPTYTVTLTSTNTPQNTVTLTATGTNTPLPTGTSTGTPTFTVTRTNTFTNTPTITPSFTITLTFTLTITPTFTNSPNVSPTPTFTNIVFTWTITQTFTISPTITITNTLTPTETITNTPSYTTSDTATNTLTITTTNTLANTITNTPINTETNTPVNTLTNTQVDTATNTPTVTPTIAINLVANITISPTSAGNGQDIIVIMQVVNTGLNTAFNVVPSGLSQSGGGAAILASGPNPVSTAIAGSSQASFTWVYTVAICSNITFNGTASGMDAVDGATMTSVEVSSNSFTCTTATVTMTNTVTMIETVTVTNTVTVAVTATATMTTITIATTGVTDTSTPTPVVAATMEQTGTLTIGNIKPYPNPINPVIESLKIAVNVMPNDIDKITLRIYTVAYRLIREKTIDGTEMEKVGDGIILQYDRSNFIDFSAGTYYYVVIAEKGGLKARSKVDKIIILK